MTLLKGFKYKYCLNFRTCQKYVVQFRNVSRMIYLPLKTDKNWQTVEITLPIYVSTKYTILCILTCPKCDA